jgi:GNAT superfamily N-acetyltransferase
MPERLTDPRYWKQTTQDIEGAFAAPPKPQGTPGAFIENVQRPTDQFANQIGEQISPTLGAFGMGQLAGDTALRLSEGDYTGAAMNTPMLAMAMMPGAKGKKGAFGPKPADLDAFGAHLSQKYGADVNLVPLRGDIQLQHLEVPKERRKQGVGSAIMQEINDYADQQKQRVVLDTATRDDSFGTTSKGRLTKFYGRHGYVRNHGRRKDYRLNASMYRNPQEGE